MFKKLPSDKTVDFRTKKTVIECSSDGGEITWYKKGKKVGEVGWKYRRDTLTDYLQILSVVFTDEGKYTCEVKNLAGTKNASMYLTVRPTFD